MKRTASIQREIDWLGSTRIVEVSATLESYFEDRTDSCYPLVEEEEITEFEVFDEDGKDITGLLDPDQVYWLERQLWDSLRK